MIYKEDTTERLRDAQVAKQNTPNHYPSALEADQEVPITKQNILERAQELSKLNIEEYELVRKTEAKALGIRQDALDKIIKGVIKKQVSETEITFQEVPLWVDPINLSELLNDILNTIRRFIIRDLETAIAATLWCVMTWVIDIFSIAPLAVITAPQKRCGKTQLLTVIGRLVRKALATSNITPAALFRTVEATSPTLLIDEADAFMKGNEDMRGILNCGHTREMAYVIRTVGENHTPKRFNVWGAKAVAGIGKLSDTLMDRAIELKLRRKYVHEQVERLHHSDFEEFQILKSKLNRFSQDFAEKIKLARPSIPVELNDRAKDNWEPLLAIADIAGGDWPELARSSALKLMPEDTRTISIQLLMDIKDIFEEKNTDRLSTKKLILALCADDEKIWATFYKDQNIKSRQLATLLKEFGVSSKTVRIDCDTMKGYLLADFKDTFKRYLE